MSNVWVLRVRGGKEVLSEGDKSSLERLKGRLSIRRYGRLEIVRKGALL